MDTEILSSIAPITLFHVDCAPGAGAEGCITSARRLWRAELVSLPRRRPTRRRASPYFLFLQEQIKGIIISPALCADYGGLSVGLIFCWT